MSRFSQKPLIEKENWLRDELGRNRRELMRHKAQLGTVLGRIGMNRDELLPIESTESIQVTYGK
jgi:hypothetical protein